VFASASAEAEKGTSPISYGNGKRSPSITAHRALFFSRCFVPDHCGRLLFSVFSRFSGLSSLARFHCCRGPSGGFRHITSNAYNYVAMDSAAIHDLSICDRRHSCVSQK